MAIVNETIIKTKSLYARLFPLDSVRRFIVDQLIIWSIFLGYYAIIIGIILSIVALLFYATGLFLEPHLSKSLPTVGGERIAMAILVGFSFIAVASLIIMGLIWSVIGIYHLDYLKWLEEQNVEAQRITKESFDVEMTDTIPIDMGRCRNTIRIIFPLTSIQRYLGGRFIYSTVAVCLIVIHMLLSVWLWEAIFGKMFRAHSQEVSFLGVWWISLLAQIIIGFVIRGLYECFSEPCRRAWRNHISRAHSAATHKI